MRSISKTGNKTTRRSALLIAIALTLAIASALAGCAQSASSSAASASSDASSEVAASVSAESSSQGAISFSMKVDATEADAGILYDGVISVEEGTSAYEALVDSGLELDVGSTSGSVYVDGIGGVVASKTSPTSGWLYTINDEVPSVGADAYILQDGDKIVWTFYKDAMSQS